MVWVSSWIAISLPTTSAVRSASISTRSSLANDASPRKLSRGSTSSEEKERPPFGGRAKIHRAGFAFVTLVQPAFRLGIAPLPFDRSVEASTYSRALLGARGNLRGRGHQVNTSRQRFVAICADHFREAIQTLSSPPANGRRSNQP